MNTTKKQPAALANYQQRKQEKEAAALAPFTVKREKYGRGYIVSTTGADYIELDDKTGDCRSFETKKAAVAWIMEEKARAAETARPENISNDEKKEEANTMSSIFTFTPDTMTCKGKTFPAEYSVTPSGAVFVFIQEEGKAEKTRIKFNPDHTEYAAALAAARAEKAAPAPAETPADNAPETVASAPETIEQPAAVEETPAPAAAAVADGKATRGPVPEKTFIGETIQGNGWKILFDGETSRTRIIFEAAPVDAARAALDKAGFYFSAAMNSWNKKLTFKARRAAQALALELETIYPAAA